MIFRKLKKIVEEFRSSQFCFDLLQGIGQCLEAISKKTVDKVVCYGLGNFSESKCSLHQLAALIIIHEKFSSTVELFDPVFHLLEIKLLGKLGFEVLPENEEGKRKISENQVYLIFLPHCPKQLANNFLWANWNLALKNCILFTNSFSRVIEDNTKKSIQKSANYIFKIYPKTKEIVLENTYFYKDIFNDISIHYFNDDELSDSFFISNLESEPVYLEDTEFITKHMQILGIDKNE